MIFCSPVAILSWPFASASKVQCGLYSCGTFCTETKESQPLSVNFKIASFRKFTVRNGLVTCNKQTASKKTFCFSYQSKACLITAIVGVSSCANSDGRTNGTG